MRSLPSTMILSFAVWGIGDIFLGTSNTTIGVVGKYVGLQDAYRVEPRIVVWRGEEVVQVPLSALFRRGDDWVVLRDDSGTAALTVIKIGQRNDDFAQVMDGLNVGDKVILHPSEDISDGSRVAPR